MIRPVGALVVIASALALLYLFVGFDTTVAVTAAPTTTEQALGLAANGTERVENIGRLNQRQNGVIASSAGAVIGVLLFLIGTRTAAAVVRPLGRGLVCPACGLINPQSVTRCDCGADLTARQ